MRRADEPELHRVPVQAGEQLAGVEAARLQSAGAVGLHVVGEHRVEQQRHVAEEVVEHVGLDDVVELLRPADPAGDRKLAPRQQREERFLGDQPRHRDHVPPGGTVQRLRQLVEARNAVGSAEPAHRQFFPFKLRGLGNSFRGDEKNLSRIFFCARRYDEIRSRELRIDRRSAGHDRDRHIPGDHGLRIRSSASAKAVIPL